VLTIGTMRTTAISGKVHYLVDRRSSAVGFSLNAVVVHDKFGNF
jgi:hypothetical protein